MVTWYWSADTLFRQMSIDHDRDVQYQRSTRETTAACLCQPIIWSMAAIRALTCVAVKRAGPSKMVRCNRLGFTKTSRFRLLALELRFLNPRDSRLYELATAFGAFFCSEAMGKGGFFRVENKTSISRWEWIIRSAHASCKLTRMFLRLFWLKNITRKLSTLVSS